MLTNDLEILREFWGGKRVLITGHTGFKGAWLVQFLSFIGADISGFSLPPTQDQSLHGLFSSLSRNFYGDIRNKLELKEAFEEAQPEVVFHLAAQPIVLISYASPSYTYEVNVNGTINILELCREYRVRSTVNVTTDKVYKNLELSRGYTEDDELGGFDPYSNSKACSELISKSYYDSFFKELGLGLATARAGNVIGSGDFSPFRLVPSLLQAISEGQPLVLRNPNSVRPWQHVLDPLFGYILLARSLWSEPEKISGPWNFASNNDESITVRELVYLLLDAFDADLQIQSSNTIAPPNQHETKILKLDSSKAISLLQWYPRISLQHAAALISQNTITQSGVDIQNVKTTSREQIREYLDTHL